MDIQKLIERNSVRLPDQNYSIGGHGCFRVLWLKNGKGCEHISPRIYLNQHAIKLLNLLQNKHGQSNAIIYAD